MEEAEVIGSLGGRDAEEQPTAKRKRVRSGESGSGSSEDPPNPTPVTKKVSITHMDSDTGVSDSVALLDAGAQYGKVIWRC